MNRTGKSADQKSSPNNQVDFKPLPLPADANDSSEEVSKKIADTRENIDMMSGILQEHQEGKFPMKLSPSEVERTKQILQKDISQYNNDIKLLSLLVGRPVTNQDISKLAATNLGKSSIRSVPVTPTATTTTTLRPTLRPTYRTTTKPPTTVFMSPFKPLTEKAFKPLSDRETQFLQALEQIQTTKALTTSTTSTVRSVSKSQEAVIAALLKQQGIGPNSQINIEVGLP